MTQTAFLVLLTSALIVCGAQTQKQNMKYEHIIAKLENIRKNLQSAQENEKQCAIIKTQNRDMNRELQKLRKLCVYSKSEKQHSVIPAKIPPSYEECKAYVTPKAIIEEKGSAGDFVKVEETIESTANFGLWEEELKTTENREKVTTPISPRNNRRCHHFNHAKLSLLPSKCGLPAQNLTIQQPHEASSESKRRRKRIVNGDEAPLFALPWMARLRYKTKSGRLEYRCGGTLISSRYVLTAAMCVHELPSDVDGLHSVILGEHTEGGPMECSTLENGRKECNPVPLTLKVENTVVHPLYTPHSLANNVALIRLSTDVNFTSLSVQPICLPLGMLSCMKLEGLPLVVSGWGRTEDFTTSTKLRWTSVRAVNTDTCFTTINNPRFSQRAWRVTLGQGHLCAGGTDTKDSCDGDGGGPLQMTAQWLEEGPRVVQFGIVSFGVRDCGNKNLPSVYTRVSHYLSWILDTIH